MDSYSQPKRLIYKGQIYPVVEHLVRRGLTRKQIVHAIIEVAPVDLDVLNMVLAMFETEQKAAA